MIRNPSSVPMLVSLDSHVHIEQGKGYEGALKNPFLTHSFLISNSYSIQSNENYGERYPVNQQLSEIVSLDPTKFTGLCGLNFAWPDINSIAQKCLKLPGIHGFKLHDLEDPDNLSVEIKFKKLNDLLNVVGHQNLVILWHVRSDPDINKKKLSQTFDEILLLAKKYPAVQFILAHAIDSFDPTSHLKMLNQKISKLQTRPDNLYIELSGIVDLCEREPKAFKVSEWKKFGTDYILLGSDSSQRSWRGEILLAEEMSFIKNNSSFSNQEKLNIIVKNGLKILEKVNPDTFEAIKGRFLSEDKLLSEIKSYDCESLKKLISAR